MTIPFADENFHKGNLSQIETRWSLLHRAHRDDGDATCSAQHELIERYAGAVYRYLLRVTHDPEVASDLTQEFAFRFLRGDFHRADPQRGLFRNYIKSAILNLLTDTLRKKKTSPGPLPDGGDGLPDPSQESIELEIDRRFLDCLRDEILSRAWERLSRLQERNVQPFYTVLRFRAEHPTLRSHEIATRLSPLLGKEVTANWVRQNLRRARERFIVLVEAEVSHSLGNPSKEERDEEMRTLGLWEYCRSDNGSRGESTGKEMEGFHQREDKSIR